MNFDDFRKDLKKMGLLHDEPEFHWYKTAKEASDNNWSTFTIDDVSIEEVLDPDMEVFVVKECSICRKKPPLLHVFEDNPDVRLCTTCRNSFSNYVGTKYGLSGAIKLRSYRLITLDNRS